MTQKPYILLAVLAGLASAGLVPAAVPPLVEAESVVADTAPPAPIPVVPLSPAIVGTLASVALTFGLRYSRHRRWITLRS